MSFKFKNVFGKYISRTAMSQNCVILGRGVYCEHSDKIGFSVQKSAVFHRS